MTPSFDNLCHNTKAGWTLDRATRPELQWIQQTSIQISLSLSLSLFIKHNIWYVSVGTCVRSWHQTCRHTAVFSGSDFHSLWVIVSFLGKHVTSFYKHKVLRQEKKWKCYKQSVLPFFIIKGERTTGVVWVTAFGLLSGECKSEVWRTQWAAPCGAEELLGKLENQETWLTFFSPTESVYLCLHVE